MAKQHTMLLLFALLFWTVLFSETSAITDPLHVTALQGLYISLNFPPQLTGWYFVGGDPCGESWKGIKCSGDAIHSIKISGLQLTGTMGFELANLGSLEELDVSNNSIHGIIPLFFPPRVTHINLAFNQLSQNIPFSLASLKSLRYLNLSHNSLSGSLGDIFTGLKNLKQMDLSHNSFTGNLPISFVTLTSLTALDLQNNLFTGSVNFLAGLPLSYLNIRNNYFSGVVPKQFELISNLSIEGNIFSTNNVNPPPNITPENRPSSQSISNSTSTKNDSHDQKTLGRWSMIGVTAFLVTCVAAYVIVHIHISCKCPLDWLECCFRSLLSLLNSLPNGAPTESPEQLSVDCYSLASPRPLLTIHKDRSKTFHERIKHTKRNETPMTAILYNMTELQAATNNFSEDNLLGMGTFGPIYKGMFPDGQILAVNIIEMAPLSLFEEDLFLDVISSVSHLRHPNMASLLGYCVEHGQYFLVYAYVGNVSLVVALHSTQDTGKTLTWNDRLRISIGVACALKYLHCTCVPPIAHGDVTAANIFLDQKLVPHLHNCGLVNLRPLIRIELEAYETATDSLGYTAPEFRQPGFDIDMTKCDTYGFGVLLLELLTGKKPYDSSKAGDRQFLVKRAGSCLHDFESLNSMVDAAIKGQCASKSLSRFADVISYCIQPQPEFRPPMSQVSEMLVSVLHQTESSGHD
ncbi:protein STRUBBELIG-RECEPTOR FAMILY 8-like [Magnolia sinica]|uniref:protein STRUBBELIG-RECEPTOR FAMILY 8-like n=1 Tax=Magnolia sinica TaxID=86752 RepID=UPI0026598845|nr:protein STRUBBELIG-RECEPTOR FAMILY 8-like [Magnolia sinica]